MTDMRQRLACELVDPVSDHADLAARLAYLRDLARRGVDTRATQGAVVEAYLQKSDLRDRK